MMLALIAILAVGCAMLWKTNYVKTPSDWVTGYAASFIAIVILTWIMEYAFDGKVSFVFF